ncbi:hypothetical protein HanIR_Chr03g0123891 [Helianthus annuus]|nr:hypothetical protein HanIR_Chr03g0123891 [Helianthus annuus]
MVSAFVKFSFFLTLVLSYGGFMLVIASRPQNVALTTVPEVRDSYDSDITTEQTSITNVKVHPECHSTCFPPECICNPP